VAFVDTNSSKFRSVGSNTIQELLAFPSPQKQVQKKNMTSLIVEDELTKVLEMGNIPGWHSGFENPSSSSDLSIYADEDADNFNLMSHPFLPSFGIEIFRKKCSLYPS